MTNKKLPYLFGFPYLLVETDLEEWCKKYNLHPFSVICDECGETRNVNIPFASKENNRRGLLAYDCSCGTSSFCYTGDDFENASQELINTRPRKVKKKKHLKVVKDEKD